MSPPSRFKRPELDRSEPIRSMTALFGPPRNGAPPRAADAAGASPGKDGVSRGVDLGYRVIDEYMRQGQSLARTMWSPRLAQETLGSDPQQLAGRMYQYASDLAGAWLEYMQAMMAQVPASPPPQPGAHAVGGFGLGTNGKTPEAKPPPPPAEARVEAPTAPSVSVQVSSRRRTEVTVDLKPGSLDALLSVYDLRARDSALPRISGVAADVSKADHRVTLRIEVPDGQPPGVYTGVIVDEASNLARGTLMVRVFE